MTSTWALALLQWRMHLPQQWSLTDPTKFSRQITNCLTWHSTLIKWSTTMYTLTHIPQPWTTLGLSHRPKKMTTSCPALIKQCSASHTTNRIEFTILMQLGPPFTTSSQPSVLYLPSLLGSPCLPSLLPKPFPSQTVSKRSYTQSMRNLRRNLPETKAIGTRWGSCSIVLVVD